MSAGSALQWTGLGMLKRTRSVHVPKKARNTVQSSSAQSLTDELPEEVLVRILSLVFAFFRDENAHIPSLKNALRVPKYVTPRAHKFLPFYVSSLWRKLCCRLEVSFAVIMTPPTTLEEKIENDYIYSKRIKAMKRRFPNTSGFRIESRTTYGSHGDLEFRSADTLLQLSIAAFPLKNIDIDNMTLTDETIKIVTKASSYGLQSLKLSDTGITNEWIKHIGENCRMLEVLHITGAPNVTEKGFCYIAKCEFLTYLCVEDAPGFTDGAIDVITQACSHIQYLHMNENRHITDTGIDSIANSLHKTLLALDIVHCNITSAGLLQAFAKCKALRSISVPSCALSDEIFAAIAESCDAIISLTIICDQDQDFPIVQWSAHGLYKLWKCAILRDLFVAVACPQYEFVHPDAKAIGAFARKVAQHARLQEAKSRCVADIYQDFDKGQNERHNTVTTLVNL